MQKELAQDIRGKLRPAFCCRTNRAILFPRGFRLLTSAGTLSKPHDCESARCPVANRAIAAHYIAGYSLCPCDTHRMARRNSVVHQSCTQLAVKPTALIVTTGAKQTHSFLFSSRHFHKYLVHFACVPWLVWSVVTTQTGGSTAVFIHVPHANV